MIIKNNMTKKKIIYKICLSSYDKIILESNLLTLLFEIKSKLNFVKLNHFYLIPQISKKTCLLRSVFVDNSSKEHLEIKNYKIFISIKIIKNKNLKILDNIILNLLKYQDLNIIFKKINLNKTGSLV